MRLFAASACVWSAVYCWTEFPVISFLIGAAVYNFGSFLRWEIVQVRQQ
jgi:hypothetical protein